jgi:hypothetical protein
MLDARAVTGPQVMRMRALGRERSCSHGQLTVGLAGRSSGRGILESNGCLLLILSDNYNRTTNDLTTEAQSARRRLLNEGPGQFYCLTILAGYRKQRPAACRPCVIAGRIPARLPVRRRAVVLGCGATRQTGLTEGVLGDMLMLIQYYDLLNIKNKPITPKNAYINANVEIRPACNSVASPWINAPSIAPPIAMLRSLDRLFS